jgi:ornithine decarboxylase
LEEVIETTPTQGNASSKAEVLKVLKERNFSVTPVDSAVKIEDLLELHVAQGAETSFYLCDVNVVIKKFFQWKELLPRVKPFYAMKCCPDPVLLWTLKTLGTGFDVASMGETELALNLNAPEDQIIFANPNKMKAHLEFAKSKNVKLMTFDGAAELQKVKETFPEAQLVLRVLPPESKFIANTTFGSKFGATWDDCEELIDLAVKLGLNLRGVSYHVGSGCYAVEAFEEAVRYARKVFDLAAEKGVKMDFLDIGGGFPGSDDGPISMKDIAQRISPVLDELFPPEVKIIAEPGRYFASACMTLASNIITVREKKVNDGQGNVKNQRLYYLSDGVYGSFNCIFYDHNEPAPRVLSGEKAKKEETRSSTLFGPTCDSIDVICRDITLPELEVGDWIYFPNMGAYTRAAGSNFNGFPIPKVIYICS